MHLNILLDTDLLKVPFPSMSSWTCGYFKRGYHGVQLNKTEMYYQDLAATHMSLLSPMMPLHLTCDPITLLRFLKHAILGLSK